MASENQARAKAEKIRPTWDEYFMKLAQLVATRSTCLRRQVGAVLVRDKRILATGYNGAPSGMAHCLDIGCIRDQLKIPSGTRAEICRAIHAEQNAIIQCAVYGVPTQGSTIYITHQPCTICTKILIGAGIKRIVYLEPYPDKFAQGLLKEARVKLEKWCFPKKMIIIGLTGPIAGGKGIVAEFLKKKGFFYSSTSDRVREEIEKRGIEITRENLQKIADDLRHEFGGEVLAKRTWEIVREKGGDRVVIDSIRGEAEVDFLKKKPNFYLIGVTSPRRLRYQRLVSRQRESDPVEWKDFLRIDRIDFKSGQGEKGRNIKACLKKADDVLINKGTIKELEAKMEEILTKIDA